eukprot:scaffold71965_cov30-Tisochrysis_lutea.AAC.1
MAAPPMRCASSMTVSRRARCVGAHTTTFAPNARAFSCLATGVPSGTTMVHLSPLPAAAAATAAAWLPLEWAATPACARSSESASTALSAPRSLNEPVACKCSALKKREQPASRSRASERSTGVRCTRPERRTAASATELAEGIARPPPHAADDEKPLERQSAAGGRARRSLHPARRARRGEVYSMKRADRPYSYDSEYVSATSHFSER